MGIIYKVFLDSTESNCNRIFQCCECKTHFSTHEEIISKAFQGTTGKAYLFNRVVNVCEGPPVERQMTTGLHTVRDIHCIACQSLVGWKYDKAYESSQRYKEGKFILERQLVTEVSL